MTNYKVPKTATSLLLALATLETCVFKACLAFFLYFVARFYRPHILLSRAFYFGPRCKKILILINHLAVNLSTGCRENRHKISLKRQLAARLIALLQKNMHSVSVNNNTLLVATLTTTLCHWCVYCDYCVIINADKARQGNICMSREK